MEKIETEFISDEGLFFPRMLNLQVRFLNNVWLIRTTHNKPNRAFFSSFFGKFNNFTILGIPNDF